jgi:sulfate permease, SulP family
MGIYDFVVGIVAGIVLACLNYVVQTSNTPALRSSYSGEIAQSTVRRPPVDKRYLNQVRSQIWVEKLCGYLFFGSIVAVETEIRALIETQNFNRRLIRYVVVDFSQVTGIDFSAAEAFMRINRVLCRKNIQMMLSSVSFSDKVGRSLGMVGLLDGDNTDPGNPLPEVYEDLNGALEACENGLLEHFYRHRDSIARKKVDPVTIGERYTSARLHPASLYDLVVFGQC